MQRRKFLERSAGTALAVTTPMVWRGPRFSYHTARAPDELMTLYDPRVKTLALTALGAARDAGARYADVRLTYTKRRDFLEGKPDGSEVMLGMSVRALVDGYWGWAATPYLSDQDAPRVGGEAVGLAKKFARSGKPRSVDWRTIPIVQDGTWSTPIRIDPFDVPTEEICDWMKGAIELSLNIVKYQKSSGSFFEESQLHFKKQESVFASTEGSYLTQTVHLTSGQLHITTSKGEVRVDFPKSQSGWEYVADTPVQERVHAEMDRINHQSGLPVNRALNVGRYDIVFTAATMASLLEGTLAPATQLDLALGYEANAGGTSYLGPDPLAILGSQIASPLITMTADRSAQKSLATIRWDNEGVAPDDFTLIKDGVLMDYQTTREQAPWIAPWYEKQGKPIRSHGCLDSIDALSYPMQSTPNLTLHPGSTAQGVDDFTAGLDHGLVVDGMGVQMDFQCLNGLGFLGGNYGRVYEIRHGRRVAQVPGGFGLLFRTPELWKNVLAVGGPASLEAHSGGGRKGEPQEGYEYSIASVPAMVKQLALIDRNRKV